MGQQADFSDQTIDELLEQAEKEERETQRLLNALLRDGSNSGCGFGDADFDYWVRLPYWTLEELVALSLGKNPEILNLQTCQPRAVYLPYCQTFMKVYELAHRWSDVGALETKVSPKDAIEWMDRIKLYVPPDLIVAQTERGDIAVDWRAAYAELAARQQSLETQYVTALDQHTDSLRQRDTRLADQDAWIDEARNVFRRQTELIEWYKAQVARLEGELEGTRADYNTEIEKLVAQLAEALRRSDAEDLGAKEKSSLQKLSLGLAEDKFAYAADQPQNSAISNIVACLERCGLAMTDKTVRKHLKAASARFPRCDRS